MKEGTKSLRRRWTEDVTGEIPWMKYISGRILDLGAGDNPLPLPNVTTFDQVSGDVQGDANKVADYFPSDTFDCIHLSQCLEHLVNPTEVIWQCLKIVKPQAFVVVSVPDVFAYEGGQWPSPWNHDHKHSFSMIYRGSKAPSHIYIPGFLKQFEGSAKVMLARFIERNYNWKIGTTIDQTLDPGGSECWNEFVLQKISVDNNDSGE